MTHSQAFKLFDRIAPKAGVDKSRLADLRRWVWAEGQKYDPADGRGLDTRGVRLARVAICGEETTVLYTTGGYVLVLLDADARAVLSDALDFMRLVDCNQGVEFWIPEDAGNGRWTLR